jgi:hypothetical protein
MKKAQLRAISYNYTRRTQERQLAVINALGLAEEFRNSKYSSYGWFLRSLGIYVTYNYISFQKGSRFYGTPEAVELEAGGGTL